MISNAIVTGAAGFIGGHLVSALQESGIEVTKYDCRVDDESELKRADVFYHLAWAGATGEGRVSGELQAQNAQMTLNMLSLAYRLGCGRFVALGTVYEKLASQVRLAEGFQKSDFYILSKDYAHIAADKLAYKLGMDFVWAAICHPIGRRMKPNQMMAYVVSNLLSGESPAFGTAQTPYDIIAVEDVALGLMLLGSAESLSKREYYIGSGSPKPLYKWLEEARILLGVQTEIGYGIREDDGLIFDEKWFDISDIINDAGFNAKVSFDEAVKNVAKLCSSTDKL